MIMIEGIIYRYVSPSGKSYIGQTTSPDKRKNQHRKIAYRETDKSYYLPFYTAIRKYGWDSFKYEVLITVQEESKKELTKKLDDLEIYYIGKYNSYVDGYNCTIGGSVLRGKDHPSYGNKLSEEHKQKLKNSRTKKVSMYTVNGEYEDTFNSAAEAATYTKMDPSGIIAVCRGKQKTAGGYQWRYGTSTESIDPVTYIKPKRYHKFGKDNPRSKTVYQYTKDLVLVKVWESALQAEREQGFKSPNISQACNHKIPFYGKPGEEKYIWSFEEL